jgi:hypothetical protein
MAVLTAVWEAAGYPWPVRLKALLPAWMSVGKIPGPVGLMELAIGR